MQCVWVSMTDLFRIDEFKLHVSSRPHDQVSVGWVVQQREQELPELQGAATLVRQTFLLHFTCLYIGHIGHNEYISHYMGVKIVTIRYVPPRLSTIFRIFRTIL